MSNASLLYIAVLCLCGISLWMVDWARSNPIDLEYDDWDYPNEEDE